MEASSSGNTFTSHDGFKFILEEDQDSSGTEIGTLDEGYLETAIEKDVVNTMPFMAMHSYCTLQPLEIACPRTVMPAVTPVQPSTSSSTLRLVGIYSEHEQTNYAGKRKRSTCNQLSSRRSRHQNGNIDEEARANTNTVSGSDECSKDDEEIALYLTNQRKRSNCNQMSNSKSVYQNGDQEARTGTNIVSGRGKCGQGERVTELYLTDEDLPADLKEKLFELEGHCKTRTLQQMNKRPNVDVDKDDNESKYESEQISIANVFFGGDNSALDFQWSPMSSFEGEQEVFQPSNVPGPRQPTSCPYEAFRQYWDDEILEHIVRETNRNASQLKSSSPIFEREWKDTNIHEILILFAFWTMFGIIQMPTINSCFSQNALLETNIFRILFTRKRYWLLNQAIHFVNNATRKPNSSKLFLLGPLVDHLNKKFSEAYTLGQDLSIGESLTLWKGPLSFKQRIKSKSIREGIKTYELCESATSYLWSFIIYSGRDRTASTSALPKNMDVVVELIKPLLNKGHKLVLGSCYNSPLLARFLKRNKTDCVGTLQKARKNVPNFIRLVRIPEGTCVARHSGDVVVMAYEDKKTVYTISTCHGSESIPVVGKNGKSLRYKPSVIVDYNKSMGGVDRMNQMLQPYLIERQRCSKWHIKMFKRLLNVSILNSRILVDRSRGDKEKHLTFRLELVQKIMLNHLALTCRPMPQPTQPRKLTTILSHFITRIEVTIVGQQCTKRGRRYCVWCKTHRKVYSQTVFKCEQCDTALCLKDCFKAYHLVNFFPDYVT